MNAGDVWLTDRYQSMMPPARERRIKPVNSKLALDPIGLNV
jgi:hypothetical protein